MHTLNRSILNPKLPILNQDHKLMNATKEDLKFGDKEEKREKKRREVLPPLLSSTLILNPW